MCSQVRCICITIHYDDVTPDARSGCEKNIISEDEFLSQFLKNYGTHENIDPDFVITSACLLLRKV